MSRTDAEEDAALSRFLPPPQPNAWLFLRDFARWTSGDLIGPPRPSPH